MPGHVGSDLACFPCLPLGGPAEARPASRSSDCTVRRSVGARAAPTISVAWTPPSGVQSHLLLCDRSSLLSSPEGPCSFPRPTPGPLLPPILSSSHGLLPQLTSVHLPSRTAAQLRAGHSCSVPAASSGYSWRPQGAHQPCRPWCRLMSLPKAGSISHSSSPAQSVEILKTGLSHLLPCTGPWPCPLSPLGLSDSGLAGVPHAREGDFNFTPASFSDSHFSLLASGDFACCSTNLTVTSKVLRTALPAVSGALYCEATAAGSGSLTHCPNLLLPPLPS